MDTTMNARPGTLAPAPLLRLALLGDAAASGGMGLLLAAGGGALAGLLGLPAGLLLGAGLVLIPYAAVIAWMARRATLPAWAVWAVVGINLAWVADSVILIASGWVRPGGLGVAFVLAQAAAVGSFAALQWLGLRRSGRG
jgi:hypothetical protein